MQVYPHEAYAHAGWCSTPGAQKLGLLSMGPTSGGGRCPQPCSDPSKSYTSASDPKQAQEQRARGFHHSSVIPCKLTRCLAALPAHVPASLPAQHSSTAAVINAPAGSPAVSAPHLLGCVSAQGLPTAQPAHTTTSGWPDTSASQHIMVLPIPTEKPHLQPSSTGAGQHSPCQATPQGPVKAMGG